MLILHYICFPNKSVKSVIGYVFIYFYRECLVKIAGEVQMSFPAGIVRAFTSNRNPPVLSFKIAGSSGIENVHTNPSLIHKWVDNRIFFL